jgi:hypothetical protein
MAFWEEQRFPSGVDRPCERARIAHTNGNAQKRRRRTGGLLASRVSGQEDRSPSSCSGLHLGGLFVTRLMTSYVTTRLCVGGSST